MMQIHRQSRTPPVVLAEIARSSEYTGVVAKRYGISHETSANGESMVSRPASTDQTGQSGCHGASPRKSMRPSAPCDERRGSHWMI